MKEKRIFYYDNIKGLLILCIVLMHTLSTCSKYYGYSYDFFKLISFFLIPLFIFITGKFSKKSKRTPFERFIKLISIYIIIQILITIYYEYVINIVRDGKSILIPRFTLWYLLTTSCLYLSEYIFRKYKFKYVFIISIIIALLSGFINIINDYLSIQRTISFLPFFILGYYSGNINYLSIARKYKNLIFILVILITICFFLNQGFLSFKDTYLKYNYFLYDTPLECFLKRFLIYIFYIIFSTSILLIAPLEKTNFSIFGYHSLIIYILHGVILKTIYHYKIFIGNSLMGTTIIYIFVITTIMLIGIILDDTKKLLLSKKY